MGTVRKVCLVDWPWVVYCRLPALSTKYNPDDPDLLVIVINSV